MSKKNPSDKELRAHGYMTINEFVDRFAFGLKEHLHTNWKSSPDELLHPEDLTSNMLSYAESVYSVVGIFGVGSTNVKE